MEATSPPFFALRPRSYVILFATTRFRSNTYFSKEKYMAGKFEIKTGKSGKFTFNLKASNG